MPSMKECVVLEAPMSLRMIVRLWHLQGKTKEDQVAEAIAQRFLNANGPSLNIKRETR